MTSFGDIFYQAYKTDTDSPDLTFNSGPNSAHLSLTEATERLASDWLREAEADGLNAVEIPNGDVHGYGAIAFMQGVCGSY